MAVLASSVNSTAQSMLKVARAAFAVACFIRLVRYPQVLEWSLSCSISSGQADSQL